MTTRAENWLLTFVFLSTSTSGLAGSEVPPLEVSLHLQGEGTDHLTGNGSELECSGGEWQFDWTGRVPGESADADALLAGDAMYYTRDESSGWKQRPSLRGVGIECTARDRDGHPFRASRGNLHPHGNPRVDVQMSFESSSPYLSVNVHDVALCRVELPNAPRFEMPFDIGVHSGTPAIPAITRFTPTLQLTREEVEQGFDKTWQVAAEGFLPAATQCLGQRMNGEVRVRFKVGADEPEIDFNACLNLARDESRTVTAQGTPSGGSYRFAAPPSANVIQVKHSSPAANHAQVIGAHPGRGDFKATYSLRGKHAEKSIPASVVSLVAIGDGNEIEMGLMDTEGNPIDTPLHIPFRSDPPNAGDLLVFKSNNPKSLSIATGRQDVVLQATAPGVALVQAETLCGTPLGPSLKVRVVRCDKETRSRLERKKNSLKERTQSILRQVADILTDDEFNRVEREIKDDTINLWIKTSESIAGTLSLAQAQRIKGLRAAYKSGKATQAMVDEAVDLMEYTPAIEAATKVYDYYDTSMDVLEGVEAGINLRREYIDGTKSYDGLDKGELEAIAAKAYDGLAKGTLAAIAFVAPDAFGLGKSYGEAAMAAEKMGQNLGTMLGAADRLADLDVQHADILWEADRVGRFLKRCGQNTNEPDASKPQKRKSKKKPTRPEEQQVDPVADETGSNAENADEIVDPKEPKRQTMTGSMCAPAEKTPQALASAIRADRLALENLSRKLRERATAAEAPHRWAEAMRAALTSGPDALQAQLPELRRQLEQSVQGIIKARDATVADLKDMRNCADALPGRALDLQSLKWKLGP